MKNTLKILSALLTYPSEEFQKAGGEMKDVLRKESAVSKKRVKALCSLLDRLTGEDLLDAQERYVFLFDRSRALSLHLFEHIHGESRDRGQAMVDLLDIYRENGLDVAGKELPDYLPLFLEFLSTLPGEKARELLQEPLHIIAAIRTRLQKRDSLYAEVFLACEDLAKAKADTQKVEEILEEEPDIDPNDQDAIDAAWEEQEVRFGPENQPDQGCPKMKNILETMNEDLKPGEKGLER